MTLLLIKNVKAYYQTSRGFVRAVDGVTLNVDYGDVLGIAGESGCGKSTIANVFMMNVRPPLRFIEGAVILKGKHDLAGMSRKQVRAEVWGHTISLVPQSALNALVPIKRVGRFIGDVMGHHLKMTAKEAVDLAEKRFQELGLLSDSLDKYPHELSGGMKQRVVIAIATLLNPQLLIVDEPTSAIDVSTQKQVLKMLKHLMTEGIVKGIIFIAHDMATMRQLTNRVAIMYAGKIVEISPIDKILNDQLHPYTEGLVRSAITPEKEVKLKGLSYISGEPPNLLSPPLGCRFRARCSRATDICSIEEPSLKRAWGDSLVACHHVLGEQ